MFPIKVMSDSGLLKHEHLPKPVIVSNQIKNQLLMLIEITICLVF